MLTDSDGDSEEEESDEIAAANSAQYTESPTVYDFDHPDVVRSKSETLRFPFFGELMNIQMSSSLIGCLTTVMKTPSPKMHQTQKKPLLRPGYVASSSERERETWTETEKTWGVKCSRLSEW
ncbi:hypothetical protein NFI96_025396 [Prochilodus magdalenae]|nr:hypothetical protein NFI96_025396 [Prochilodus magdalenae]